MKKLIVLALVTLSFVGCKKDLDQHCWSCYYMRTFPDKNNNYTTLPSDTMKFCDWTVDDKNLFEGNNKSRSQLDTLYSDTYCIQQPDK